MPDKRLLSQWRTPRRQMLAGIVLMALAAVSFVITRRSGDGADAISPDFIPKTAYFARSGATLALEVATSTEARILGLSGREALPENTALLMIFPEDGIYGIWMKDMLFVIDVLWIDYRGTIVDIVERMTPETYPQAFVPGQEVRYVIEAPAGFVAEHGITAGERVRFK